MASLSFLGLQRRPYGARVFGGFPSTEVLGSFCVAPPAQRSVRTAVRLLRVDGCIPGCGFSVSF